MHIMIKTLSALLLVLLAATSSAGGIPSSTISMNLPEAIINETLQKSLPLFFDVNSDTLLGSISVDKIENLQLKKNVISSRITLSGHDLRLVTHIAGQAIRMKIGSLTLAFQCDTTIRFDPKKQTLYLRPKVNEIQQGGNSADVASPLMLLFNNREIPLRLQKLKPFLADTSRKTIAVAMHVADIGIVPGTLQLHLTPEITVQKKKSGK